MYAAPSILMVAVWRDIVGYVGGFVRLWRALYRSWKRCTPGFNVDNLRGQTIVGLEYHQNLQRSWCLLLHVVIVLDPSSPGDEFVVPRDSAHVSPGTRLIFLDRGCSQQSRTESTLFESYLLLTSSRLHTYETDSK